MSAKVNRISNQGPNYFYDIFLGVFWIQSCTSSLSRALLEIKNFECVMHSKAAPLAHTLYLSNNCKYTQL